jgi:DNA polymerase III subunit gamma/tau
MEEKGFVVSALKYRPSIFSEVVAQKGITSTLMNAIESEELAKAYLFCGPRGVGKTTCARIFAKAINAKYIPEGTDMSFNIFEMDAASNNSVDDIRNLIDQVRIQPQLGKYKVYVIDEVHMLSSQAFNAFLKTLEEPPAHAIFILATTEKHKVLPTILSRCQIYDFQRIQVKDIVEHLAHIAQDQNVTYQDEALHLIANKADGALRDALSLYDQMVSFTGKNLQYQAVADNLNVLDHDYFLRITDHVLAGEVGECLLILDEILQRGFDGLMFLLGLAEHLRNLLVSMDPATLRLLDTTDQVKESYQKQSSGQDSED